MMYLDSKICISLSAIISLRELKCWHQVTTESLSSYEKFVLIERQFLPQLSELRFFTFNFFSRQPDLVALQMLDQNKL